MKGIRGIKGDESRVGWHREGSQQFWGGSAISARDPGMRHFGNPFRIGAMRREALGVRRNPDCPGGAGGEGSSSIVTLRGR